MNFKTSNVFVVGAGGIGCELLKNLALTGFKNISLIDLDTIEISNLNRQFLFQKIHVGQSKAMVAKASILQCRPDINIEAYHDTINNPMFDVTFFRKFDLVFSALDNIAVRYHLNRMCLAANIPLIESGTSGYFGQIKPIFKGLSECYDCLPRISSKTNYASCTIRNTPSEPVHCIVWAKNLFNVLFGEHTDADDEDQVSPEIQLEGSQTIPAFSNGVASNGEGEAAAGSLDSVKTGISTHRWACMHDYDPGQIAWKLFKADVQYLLGMGDLWVNRRAPVPLEDEVMVKAFGHCNPQYTTVTEPEDEQRKVWDLDKCFHKFQSTLDQLYVRNGRGTCPLTWDKEDAVAMDFVTAASNIRSHVFGIPLLPAFDVKSIAGNIIPALSTTNAIVAGLIVAQACDILSGRPQRCRTLFLKTPNPKYFNNSLIGVENLRAPNPTCYSCAPMPQVYLCTDPNTFLIRQLMQILVGELYLAQPDVTVDDGKGTVLISSEEGETTGNESKPLSHFGLRDGSRLVCDDFLQNYSIVINVVSRPKLPGDRSSGDPGALYELSGDVNPKSFSGLEEILNDTPSTSQSTYNGEGSPESAATSLKIKSYTGSPTVGVAGIKVTRSHGDHPQPDNASPEEVASRKRLRTTGSPPKPIKNVNNYDPTARPTLASAMTYADVMDDVVAAGDGVPGGALTAKRSFHEGEDIVELSSSLAPSKTGPADPEKVSGEKGRDRDDPIRLD